jgi:polar amino acid transport system substrate-binding protein
MPDWSVRRSRAVLTWRGTMKTLWLLALLTTAPVAQAEMLTFNTESYPPYAFRDGETLRGVNLDQIDVIMRGTGTDHVIAMMPWARAIALVETQSMQCVAAAARTPEREDRFKWVSPILVDRSILTTRSGSTVKATSLSDAIKYSVGTQREDYTEKVLRQHGFSRIDVSSDFNITLNKLLSGRIDLMPMSENVYDKLRKDGTAVDAVTLLTQQMIGIGCSKDVPDELIARMQANLDRMIADGTQNRIFAQYGFPPNR